MNSTAIAQPNPSAGIRLGRILGIPIYLHPSWFIIFALITFSLQTQFTSQYPSWSLAQCWALGILTSALFFASIVFHEVSHSVVALRYLIPVRSITLFVFGGLAKIEHDPENAKQEFTIAIAGPFSSLFLAGFFWLISHLAAGHEMVATASRSLSEINLVLAVFNLLPGFPLDGGRILRGIVWGVTKNFTRATEIASRSGNAIAYLMIFVGVWQALNGNWFGGLWTAFIGWFLLSASQESFAQVAIRNILSGVRAEDLMSSEIPTVARDISVEEYVHEMLRTGRQFHIVTGAGNPVGFMTLDAARTVPRGEWFNTSIQPAMLQLDRIRSATPDEPAVAVLDRMQKENIHQMPVISDGHIVGMIARDAIFRVLQMRMQAIHFGPH
jgi:Zn-dependent protease